MLRRGGWWHLAIVHGWRCGGLFGCARVCADRVSSNCNCRRRSKQNDLSKAGQSKQKQSKAIHSN